MDSPPIDTHSRLPGTVKFYTRHLIVCSGHNDWPSKIEEAGGFLTALNEKVKAGPAGKETRLTACSSPSPGPGNDILVYPDQVRLTGLTERDLPALLEYLSGEQPAQIAVSPLEKPLFLVCAHYNRDPRCGRCGPGLHAKFHETLDRMGLADRAEVWRSSHLGGHRFAGIVVSYPSGNWYGRVTAEDVPRLVRAELEEAAPYAKLWRGRMGWDVLKQLAFAEGLTE